MLSFVIATYHNPPRYSDREYLRDCITSIRESAVEAGAFGITEIIVVDGGSPEELDPGYWDLPQRGVTFTSTYVDVGVCNAFRIGAERAVEAYIVPLNADDRVGRGFVAAVQNAFTQYAIEHVGWMPKLILLSAVPLSAAIEKSNYLPYCAAFRSDFWQEMNGFEDVVGAGGACPLADWDLWIRCWQYFDSPRNVSYRGEGDPPIAYIAEDIDKLFLYRHREDSASRWSSDEFERMRAIMYAKRGIKL